MKKFYILFVCMVAIILVLTACGTKTSTSPAGTTSTSGATTVVTTSSTPTKTSTASTTSSPSATPTLQPVYGGTWILMSDTNASAINPPADGGSISARWLAPCLEPLLRLDANGKLMGHLAESWDLAPDGKSVTFHIRKNVKFHDGTPLNASAVKYNLEKTAKSGIFGATILKVATSYEIIDDYTLKANITGYNYNYFTALAGLVGMIASPAALEKTATEDNRAQLHMVGTGPFVFKEWKRDDRIIYDKNPNYWQAGKPYVDQIVIRYIADRTVALMAFQGGEADEWATGLEKATSDMLEQKGYKITSLPLRWQFAMVWDSADKASPFSNKAVREAVHYGVNKLGVVDSIGGGVKRGYTPLYQMAEPGNEWYVPTLPARQYDLAKAKQLLASAGYPQGFKTTLISDTFAERPFLEALQLELKKMGIDATLDIADLARIASLEMGGWTGLLHPGFPTASTVGGLYSRWGDPNMFVSMYKPDGWNETWAAMISEPDDNKRIQLMKELVKLDYNEVVTFTWRADAPYLVSYGKSHGFVLHMGGAMDYWWPEVIWKEKK